MVKRRDFLRATAVTAITSTFAGALVATGCGVQREEGVEDGAPFFPQSVASGDPRPHSVVLWTRVEDPGRGSGDVMVSVQVSTAEDFSDLVAEADVRAPARHDHCAKVKVVGLDPATTYYYRFLYTQAGRRYASRTGRTRTAPAEGADTPVRFAFVSCQGRADGFYNAHLLLAREDVDFVVHLGDYIHETTAEGIAPERAVSLADEAGAVDLGDGRLAAASLDNYREIYRRYRADPSLQRLHERFAVVTVWNDHEFSGDCYGAAGTYTNGQEDEVDEDRRKAANRAWFEYQPVDYGDEDFSYDPAAAFPGDLRIYRDLAFGRHVHLVVTDLRTYRSDHVVPEEGLPGAVVVDQAALLSHGPVPSWARPYVEIETYVEGLYRDVLRTAADRLGYDATLVQGLIAVDFVNEGVRVFNEAQPDEAVPEIGVVAQADLPRGISLRDLGKRGFHSACGSRSLVVKEAFDIHARHQYEQSDGRSERVMGPDQEAWFLRTMQQSEATWKVWGSAYALSQLAVDLTDAPLPAELRRRHYLSADAWDGFRNRRNALLAGLAPIGGVVALSGGAQAFLAGTPSVEGDPSRRIVEVVGAGLSSRPLGAELEGEVARDPELSQIPELAGIAAQLEDLLTSPAKKTNPLLGLARTQHNGYVVVEADAHALTATLRLINPADLRVDYTGREEALSARTQQIRVRTLASGADLYLEESGGWRRWDAAQAAWV